MERRLPAFTMLIAFETAARLSSFSKAAQELNVTQPAVSKQVRGLETALGRQLFRRGHRSIELTDAGEVLARAMSHSLMTIGGAIRQLENLPQRSELTIAALPAFSNLWLAPRLSTFHLKHPTISVHIIAQESMVNLANGSIDVALRFGAGNWSDGNATLLYHDQIFPVCSPNFADTTGPLCSLTDIAEQPLIGYDKVEKDWVSWGDWLDVAGYHGVPVRVRAQYSNYPDAILATIGGQGIALGWQALVQDYLRQGRLVRLPSPEIVTRSAHFAVQPRSTSQDNGASAFISWLRYEIAQAGLNAAPKNARLV